MRHEPPPPPSPLSAREMLRVLRDEPSKKPGWVNIFVGKNWTQFPILPRMHFKVVGAGLVFPEYNKDVSPAEAKRLWCEQAAKLQDAHGAVLLDDDGNPIPRSVLFSTTLAPAPEPVTPTRKRRRASGQSTEPDSVSGVTLGPPPTKQELADVGRKDGFRLSSRRFGRTR